MNLNVKVYEKLLEVPEGRITTYKELANAVGLKNGSRVIGNVMKKNPFPILIPCHRVIKSNGEIGGYTNGKKTKFSILSKEGIKIKNGCVLDFERKKYFFRTDYFYFKAHLNYAAASLAIFSAFCTASSIVPTI